MPLDTAEIKVLKVAVFCVDREHQTFGAPHKFCPIHGAEIGWRWSTTLIGLEKTNKIKDFHKL